MVVAPVRDQFGKVVGVIQAINKTPPASGWEHRLRNIDGGGTPVPGPSHDASAAYDEKDATPGGVPDDDTRAIAESLSAAQDLHWSAAEALSVSLQVLLMGAGPSPGSEASGVTVPEAPTRRPFFAQTPRVPTLPAAGLLSPKGSHGLARSSRNNRRSGSSHTSTHTAAGPALPSYTEEYSSPFAGLLSPRNAAFPSNEQTQRDQTAGAGAVHSGAAPLSKSSAWATAAAVMTEDLQSRQFVPFSSVDVATIESLAMSVGGCLHRAHMFEAVLRSQRKAEALLEIVRATASEQGNFFSLARE